MSNDYDYDDEPVPMEPGSLKVSGTSIEWDAARMFSSIVNAAAGAIVKQCQRDLVSAVGKAVHDQVQAQVGAKVAEILDTNIQPTNEWGESKGAALSLRELVGKTARDYLGTKVDKEGRPGTYHADHTRIEHIVKQVVAKEFDYSMQTEIKKAVEMARAEAIAKVGSVVGDLIVKLGK